jgi:MoxR-like ATPase
MEVLRKLQHLRDNLGRVIRGKSEVLEQLIVALLARGSVLLEDVPGVGKTTLAKTLAASVDISFQRVQCTPDLLPSDIFGFSVFNPQDGQFTFRPGPIFCNVLLLDEINRASPRTQSALLEAMAEGQVTVDGTRHPLEIPFMVLATQNPSGFQGTYPLPESQLDRFLFLLSLDYPDAESEVDILYDQIDEHPLRQIAAVLTKEELLECQSHVGEVALDRNVARYLVEIVRRTRQDPRFELGSSPRGSLMLFRAAQAKAMLDEREFVIPDDIQQMAPLVLSHRVILAGATSLRYQESREVIEDVVRRVKVPV